MKLTGYEEIAQYLIKNHTGKCSARTALRYARRWGLPVQRFEGGPVVADSEAVDAWAKRRQRQPGRGPRVVASGNG